MMRTTRATCQPCGEQVTVWIDAHPCGGDYIFDVEGECRVTHSYHSPSTDSVQPSSQPLIPKSGEPG